MAQPLHANRSLRVVIVGGGASGLLMAYKLQRNFDDITFQIYEKNSDIGGTWLENRYPGCACDNPAHTYVWVSFETLNVLSNSADCLVIRSESSLVQHVCYLDRNLRILQKIPISIQPWTQDEGQAPGRRSAVGTVEWTVERRSEGFSKQQDRARQM